MPKGKTVNLKRLRLCYNFGMKFCTDNRGIAHMAIFVVVALAAIGFVGYTAWNSYQTQEVVDDTQAHQSTNDETASWKSYSRYGLAFKYPAEWILTANDNSQSTATYLASPDLSGDEKMGEQVTVDEAQFAESDLNADNFKTKHLDPNPNPYSDYKVLTINGEKAVQFYRGDSTTTVFFLADGKTVTFVLDTFPETNANSAVYDKILNSVEYE